MNIVLFLGAGFSSAYDHPTMNSFMVSAERILTNEEMQFMAALALQAFQANRILESKPFNLEDILSFAVMSDRLGFNDGQPVTPRVQHILRKVYSHLSPSGVQSGYMAKYANFKHLLMVDDEPALPSAIITTNYDLNIESALDSLSQPFDYGIDYTENNAGNYNWRNFRYKPNGGLPIYKLHGSVNWFLRADESIVAEMKLVKTVGSSERFPLACTTSFECPGEPVIVPPSFLKPELSRSVKSIWAGAAHALSKANLLVFVGYSFPDTDVEMRYFLARSLQNNTPLRAIRIVDPCAEKIVDRLSSDRNRYGSHFKEYLQPFPYKWGEIPLKEHKKLFR